MNFFLSVMLDGILSIILNKSQPPVMNSLCTMSCVECLKILMQKEQICRVVWYNYTSI